MRTLTAFVLALAVTCACADVRPPAIPPDFRGTVMARTPRLPQPDGDARLVIAGADGRVEIALSRDVRVLEELPDGSYRHAQVTEAWAGRPVHVWFTPDTVTRRNTPAGVVARRATYLVATAGEGSGSERRR